MFSVLKAVGKFLYGKWMAFAHVLGFINTKILLTLVFVLVLTPLGLLLRLFSNDPLARKLDPAAETYWLPRKEKPLKMERYQKSF